MTTSSKNVEMCGQLEVLIAMHKRSIIGYRISAHRADRCMEDLCQATVRKTTTFEIRDDKVATEAHFHKKITIRQLQQRSETWEIFSIQDDWRVNNNLEVPLLDQAQQRFSTRFTMVAPLLPKEWCRDDVQ